MMPAGDLWCLRCLRCCTELHVYIRAARRLNAPSSGPLRRPPAQLQGSAWKTTLLEASVCLLLVVTCCNLSLLSLLSLLPVVRSSMPPTACMVNSSLARRRPAEATTRRHPSSQYSVDLHLSLSITLVELLLLSLM